MKKHYEKEVIPSLIPVWEIHLLSKGGWLRRTVLAVQFHRPTEEEMKQWPPFARVGKYRVMRSQTGMLYRVNETPVDPKLIIGTPPNPMRSTYKITKAPAPAVTLSRSMRVKRFLAGLVSGSK